MIFYLAAKFCRQKDYGLEIPILSTRPTKVVDDLKSRFGDKAMRAIVNIENPSIADEDLLRVHEHGYIQRLNNQDTAASEVIRAYELKSADGSWHRYNPATANKPLIDLVAMQRQEVAAGLQAAKSALKQQFAYFLGGGMHHAMHDLGRGFCIYNDVMIIAKHLQAEGNCQQIWVIDVDAHKGDGSASLAQHDPSVTTLSIHMADAWPLDVPDDERCLIASDIDVAIFKGEDDKYLPRLASALQKLRLNFPRPDFVIVVNGSDPYAEDALPSTANMQLSLAQLLERDLMIYQFCRNLQVPQLWLMAGGYGEDAYRVHSQFLAQVLNDSP